MMIRKYQGNKRERKSHSAKVVKDRGKHNETSDNGSLIFWGALTWSHAMAQTQEQGHQHEQQQESKEAPADKGVSMKDEMKQKMKEKLKDMKCCPKEEQKQPKS